VTEAPPQQHRKHQPEDGEKLTLHEAHGCVPPTRRLTTSPSTV
jgi:hypothetical protein